MAFKHSYMILLVLVSELVSCSGRLPGTNDDDSDSSIRLFSEGSDAFLPLKNGALFIDTNVEHILRFGVEPLSYKAAYALPFLNHQWFMAQKSANYFVTTSAQSYAIIPEEGDALEDPLEVDEDIDAVGFSSDTNTLVLVDELGSIYVLLLKKDGSVAGKFKGEANFGKKNTLVTAAFLNDGNLIASIGETTLVNVDLAASVKQGEWVYTEFDVDGNDDFDAASSMTWMAAVSGQDDLVLIKDQGRLLVVSLSEEKIVDAIDLSAKVSVRAFRESRPHVLTFDNLDSDDSSKKTVQLYYVANDGSLASETIVGQDYTESYLTSDLSRLVLATNTLDESDDEEEQKNNRRSQNAFMKGSVYWYNLRKGVPEDKLDVSEKVRLGFSDDYLMLNYDSPLGKIERYGFNDAKKHDSLEGFNLPILRKKYD